MKVRQSHNTTEVLSPPPASLKEVVEGLLTSRYGVNTKRKVFKYKYSEFLKMQI